MTIETATANIDQGFFGFDGANGLSLVAGSFNFSEGTGQAWTAQLLPHVRLSSSYGMPPPDSALAYLRLPKAMAAVVRRVNRGQYAGRNNSHVLVGSAQILTPEVALGLAEWSGWLDDRPADGRMDRLRPQDLSDAAATGSHRRAQSLRRPDLLEKVLAWELQTAGKPLTIIGCPDEDRIGLLWGLLRLCGSAGLAPPEWTFSTYEVEHADSIKYLPRIVFMPDRPDGTAVARRTVVDLTREQWASPRNEEIAKRLVSDYQDGTEVIPVYEPDPVKVPAPPSQPVEELQETFLQSGSANGQTLAQEPSTQFSYVDTARVSQLVRKLLYGSPPDVIRAYNVLWAETTGSPEGRAAARAALNAASWDVSQLERQTERRGLAQRFYDLLKLAFGTAVGDLRSERGYNDALQLIETTSSEDLVRALARLADQHGYLKELAPALGHRWVGPAPSTEPVPVRGGLIARVLALFGKPVTAGQERLIAAGLILLAIMVSFFAGCAAADSEPPVQKRSTSDVSTTPSPTPGPTSPPIALPPNAKTAGEMLGAAAQDTLQVKLTESTVPETAPPWVFVGRDATLYPQAERCRMTSDTTWLCDVNKPQVGWRGGEEIIIVLAPPGSRFDANGIRSLPDGSVELFRAQL